MNSKKITTRSILSPESRRQFHQVLFRRFHCVFETTEWEWWKRDAAHPESWDPTEEKRFWNHSRRTSRTSFCELCVWSDLWTPQTSSRGEPHSNSAFSPAFSFVCCYSVVGFTRLSLWCFCDSMPRVEVSTEPPRWYLGNVPTNQPSLSWHLCILPRTWRRVSHLHRWLIFLPQERGQETPRSYVGWDCLQGLRDKESTCRLDRWFCRDRPQWFPFDRLWKLDGHWCRKISCILAIGLGCSAAKAKPCAFLCW